MADCSREARGYASPTTGQIFNIGGKLSEPFHDRLFFAGEHTQMDFFGYMEGALRSGDRAAEKLILQACGLLKKPVPLPAAPRGQLASARPVRETPALQNECRVLAEEAESPFLHQELFVAGSEDEWEPRAAALASESPFLELTVEAPEEESDFEDSEVTGFDAEDAAEYDIEDDRPFEALAPKVSAADLRTRIDEYFELANAEYTLPARTLSDGTHVAEVKLSARPQFRYARRDSDTVKRQAITSLTRLVGGSLKKADVEGIRKAVYGRPKPSQIAAITQALIDKGKLDAVRADEPTLSDDQLVRALQPKFKVGIDCAGYVQLAFIFAFTGSDNDPPRLRKSLGLHERRGEERLRRLPATHFAKVAEADAQTGDLIVLKDPADSIDHAWHTVIVVDHTVSGDVHTFLVDASWGTDLYGAAAGGVARRTLEHDTASGKWWDRSPVTGTVGGVALTAGDKAFENSVGPYNGHPVHGIFRAKQKR